MKNHSIGCKVIQNKGLQKTSNQEPCSILVIQTKSNKIYQLSLRDIWVEASNYIWVGAELFILYVRIDSEDNKQLILDNNSYLILEPDNLINPTTIRGTEGCIRKYYIQKRLGINNLSYPMLRGTMVNTAFDLMIEKKLPKEEILEKVLKDNIIQLASLNGSDIPSPESIRAELMQHLNSLFVWKTHKRFLEAKEKTTEPSFISYKYGLSGRLDLLADRGESSITYELKTGKAPESTPWRNDYYQVACYQLLLESAFNCVNPDSYLIYSQGKSNELLRQCSVDYLMRRKVIDIRNKIVAIDYLLTHDLDEAEELKNIKSLIEIEEKFICEKCLQRKECLLLCRKLKEKKCSICSSQESCDNYFLHSKDLEYYKKYFQLVELERHESRKNFAKIFHEKELLIDDGKLITSLKFESLSENLLTLTSDNPIESELRAGDMGLLYTDKITKGEIFKTTIKYIDKYKISMQLKKEIPQTFFENKEWNVYMDTVETSFNIMNGALYSFLDEKNLGKRDLILGRRKADFGQIEKRILKKSLNSKQKYAINKALSAKDYFLIQGPPGTGKSHTLANLIKEFVKDGNKVLISAFTHRSIDNVLIKLLEEDFDNFLRIGSHEIVDSKIHPYLLQEKFKNYSFKDIKDVQKELEDCPVIACSSISALNNPLISKLNFDVAVVDEASQLTEAGTLAIILQANKFILVGDHKQLPPVVQSEDAKKLGFSQSLFERLIKLNEEKETISKVLVTLEEQYRMNEEIMEFSNKQFYNYVLKANEEIANQKLNFISDISDSKYKNILLPESTSIFVNVDSHSNGNPRTNHNEAELIVNIFNDFIKNGIEPEKIGIITPFRAQVAEIKRKFSEFFDYNIAVDTVDRFQGSDRDIIIFSSVITNKEQLSEFFCDERRINVTITRAKKKFILVGNKEILQNSDLFKKLLEQLTEVGLN